MCFSLFLPILVSGAGLFMLVKLRFFFIVHPTRSGCEFFRELRSPRSRRALWLALAGTLGVGNIFGVAAGIMIGGAGSVFWLLFSSIFSMALKYSETTLALSLKSKDGHGMHTVLRAVFPRFGGKISKFYAIVCLILSLFMGSAIQSSAFVDTAQYAFAIARSTSAILLAFLCLIPMIGGADKIERVSSYLIPLATAAYILLSLASLVRFADRIPTALIRITEEAFTPLAPCGGLISFLTSRALYEGFARGLLSNEAGVGTSAMAHSRSDERAPRVAGLFGICEVFFDTVLLCGSTALVILCSVKDIQAYETPMSLVVAAFEASLGGFARLPLTLCILIFAYSTMICWYYYGCECRRYIFGKGGALYTFAFIFFIFVGSIWGHSSLILITDILLFLMAAPTCAALIRRSDEIYRLTKNEPH